MDTGYGVHVTPEWTGCPAAIMSMMAIMDRLVMSGASHESAVGTEYAAAKRQAHQHYSIALKRRIVEETFAPGASVSVVARRHDVNANLVFDWRKKYRQGKLVDRAPGAKAAPAAPDLLRIGVVEHAPVVIEHAARSPAEPPKRASPGASGVIEIDLRNGMRVRVDAGIDDAALRRVLSVIRDVG